MLGGTNCAQGSQDNDPVASAKTKDDTRAAAATGDTGEVAATEVGRAFHESERWRKAAKLKTGEAATTYLPTSHPIPEAFTPLNV